MLKRLTYNVEFSATGRTLSAAFAFQEGLTTITGPNESGKSFAIEMLRFCLFGSGALRGTRDDYKSLKAQLDLSIRGIDYRIERSLSNAKLLSGDEALAVGTKPVNQKLLSILGFDLTVFDTACAANQSEVTRLGDMSPAERKRMVDQTIGLDRLDAIQAWAAEQRLMMGREVEVLAKGLVEPLEPVKPEGYEPTYLLETMLRELRIQKAELDQLTGWLLHERETPQAPATPDVTATDEELAEIEGVLAEERHLRSLPVVDFDVEELRAQWSAYDAYTDQQRFLAAHPLPEMTREQIDAEARRGALLSERAELLDRQQRLTHAQAHCPECGADFYLEHEALTGVGARLAEIGEIDPTPVDGALLARERARIDDWSNPETLAEWGRVVNTPPAGKPTIERARLLTAVNGITQAELERRLAALPKLRSRQTVLEELDALRRHEHLHQLYVKDQLAYDRWRVERREKEARVGELTPAVEQLPAIERKLGEAQNYERDLSAYTAAKKLFEERSAEVAQKRLEHEGWKNVANALAEIRTRVKTYLVPSLSKVASHLLAQMTGGQRSSIVVNENFDILVDGQRIDTLSGSGKACANLALRIGLGQVLTNNVLSLFIGDEIDASMDEDRAEFTQNSLGSLADVISQIILVTHKIPSANHVVRLG